MRISDFPSLKADCISSLFPINHRCCRHIIPTHHGQVLPVNPGLHSRWAWFGLTVTSTAAVKVPLWVLVQVMRTAETQFYRNVDIQSHLLSQVSSESQIYLHSTILTTAYYIPRSYLIGKKKYIETVTLLKKKEINICLPYRTSDLFRDLGSKI